MTNGIPNPQVCDTDPAGNTCEVVEVRREDRPYLSLSLFFAFVGLACSQWVSSVLGLAPAIEFLLTTAAIVSGIVLALRVVNQLPIYRPENSLLISVSAEGLVLGTPVNLRFNWRELQSVRLSKTGSYGKLPTYSLVADRLAPAASAVPLAHQAEERLASPTPIVLRLGFLNDRKALALRDSLRCHFHTFGNPVPTEPADYDSTLWTGDTSW
ncbi:hypothetical protein [Ciceribacter ferrooxidans]|uniref:Transmembrane protein n=1 Tax=Ciceribacter ferrooxidans TaxID=2509717 RepID=A0A4Q2TI18_9HYPH|nr:hypothetical protein [Ciceribacter ferrooxidans]RYC17307.1 hypothetical protein EUU22_04760 [Ciceribacter ferrooxidans]